MKISAPVLSLLLLALPVAAQEPAAFFEKQIRPVFAAKCEQCHNSTLKTAGLDLTTSAGIAAAASGDRLLKAIGYDEKTKMPPSGKLPESMIQDLTVWVKAGAKVPDYKPAAADRGRDPRIPCGHFARRVRQGGGQVPGIAALRREVGQALAGCGALRRIMRGGR